MLDRRGPNDVSQTKSLLDGALVVQRKARSRDNIIANVAARTSSGEERHFLIRASQTGLFNKTTRYELLDLNYQPLPDAEQVQTLDFERVVARFFPPSIRNRVCVERRQGIT